MDLKERVNEIIFLMDPIVEDTGVPRNIKNTIKESRERLKKSHEKGKEEVEVSIARAVYALEEISNDINMPFHTRTEIWNLISELEKLKEEIK